MRKLMLNFLPPCAIYEASNIGVVDPLSVLLGHWYILLTLPDLPPLLDRSRLTVNPGLLSQFDLGTAGAVANQGIRRSPRIPNSELMDLVRKAVHSGVHQVLESQLSGLRSSAALTEQLIMMAGRSR